MDPPVSGPAKMPRFVFCARLHTSNEGWLFPVRAETKTLPLHETVLTVRTPEQSMSISPETAPLLRDKAEECRSYAACCIDEAERSAWLALGDSYLDVANRIDPQRRSAGKASSTRAIHSPWNCHAGSPVLGRALSRREERMQWWAS